MNIGKRWKKLIELLKDKEYRDAFVSEHIDTGLPFQIKALREKEEWSQEELGAKAGMKQERISALEDPNYGKFTLTTLKRLASAFDVALMVVFVPFSKLVDWESNLSPEVLQAVSFEKDNFSLKIPSKVETEKVVEETIAEEINPYPLSHLYVGVNLPYGDLRSKESGAIDQAFGVKQKARRSELFTGIKEKINETSLYKPC